VSGATRIRRQKVGALTEKPRGAGTAPDRFSAEAAWRWHVQLGVERLVAPIRAAVVAVNVAVWLTRPPAPGAWPAVARVVVVLAFMYTLFEGWIVYRRPDLGEPFPPGSPLFDLAFILVWVAVTGLGRSPFLPLILLGAVSAPLRLPPVGSLLAVAVYTAAYGVLAPPPERFVAAYVGLAGLVIAAWSAATQNDRRAAMRDPLTGCFTRAYALFQIEQLLDREAFPFAVLLIDLDGFKTVNDNFGHRAGDTVLAEVSRLMAGSIRQGDVLARYGGDEFLLLLPGCGTAAAAEVADRLRAGCAASSFLLRQASGAVRVTLSAGVAQAGPGCSSARLLQVADECLYRAKQVRNHIEVASHEAC
jgi:diguanylate cyclase (GGDEF)-like protein